MSDNSGIDDEISPNYPMTNLLQAHRELITGMSLELLTEYLVNCQIFGILSMVGYILKYFQEFGTYMYDIRRRSIWIDRCTVSVETRPRKHGGDPQFGIGTGYRQVQIRCPSLFRSRISLEAGLATVSMKAGLTQSQKRRGTARKSPPPNGRILEGIDSSSRIMVPTERVERNVLVRQTQSIVKSMDYSLALHAQILACKQHLCRQNAFIKNHGMEAHRARLIREQNTSEEKAAAIEKEIAESRDRVKATQRAHVAKEVKAAQDCARALDELRQGVV
ncbi:hypothetical protein DFH08DRAFT_806667 [Mycena albidolilacea]|uniref:Uncharacterized protein n=1 Tax=Mycena albidolilacea TaxID=1033008 RepID=A0AAD7A6P7_9AGAR|nr:hypothetical protein DFH08DRAFT_806667 [Mycena albidolilacea]